MKKNTYVVTIPIAGHVSFEVEATSPEEAEQKARDLPAQDGELSWETLSSFSSGNVCHCPLPWNVTVEDYGEIDE